MRNDNKMLRRTMPDYRHLLAGAILAAFVSGCGWESGLQDYDFSPSEYALTQGTPSLSPITDFRIADYTVPDTTNMIARVAMLRRKILVLRGPVLSDTDRARLAAAVERTAAGV